MNTFFLIQEIKAEQTSPPPKKNKTKKYSSEMLRIFSGFFYIQLTDSLTCAHTVCSVVYEAGGKIGAGSVKML